jgi:uncharacterized protein
MSSPARSPARGAARRPVPSAVRFPRRALGAPRRMTGLERRWLNPNYGWLKLIERTVDRVASRYLYPHMVGIRSPYSWQLPRRLVIAEGRVSPTPWPEAATPLRLLLLTDIHAGPFLAPHVVSAILRELMRLEPDVVAVAGDIVTGTSRDVEPFLDGLAALAAAPLGAWFCMGNHEYFTPHPEHVIEQLDTVGIRTLRNHSVVVEHAGSRLVIGGLDDLVLGKPDWERLCAPAGPPHVLLAHNPDVFYEAASRGIGLVLSGHTHGGQVRFPGGPPIVRQSRYCLDEGIFAFGSSMAVVSRGLGASGLPLRIGVRPEAVLLTVEPRG